MRKIISCEQNILEHSLLNAAAAAPILLLISALRSHLDVTVLPRYRNLFRVNNLMAFQGLGEAKCHTRKLNMCHSRKLKAKSNSNKENVYF